MKVRKTAAMVMAAGLALAVPAFAQTSLKEQYGGYFHVGAAINQAQIDENERLRAQIDAGMSARKHSEQSPTPAQTDAQKAAQAAVDPLLQWGEKQQ